MSPEEINISISSACGREYHKPTEKEKKSGSYYQYEPDYFRCLNLCHLMEKTLSDINSYSYWNIHLPYVCEAKDGEWISLQGVGSASSSQRCEAFLRTIGKWKDEE